MSQDSARARKELSDNENDFTALERALLKDIRGKLAELGAFINARHAKIAPNLNEAYAVLPCPACQQDALTIDDGTECLFCGYKAGSDTAANEYAINVVGQDRYRFEKDGGLWPVGFCPSCDWETCVQADDGYKCFGCGSKWEPGDLDRCGRCGRWTDSDISVCDSCFNETIRCTGSRWAR